MSLPNTLTVAENIGLHTLPFGSTASDPTNFVHGRDYFIKSLPETYSGMWTPDQSTYIRVYSLQPDNKFSGSKWNGRYPYVSKAREWLFASQLLGYPTVDDTNPSAPALVRNLPQPLDWGLNLTGAPTQLSYDGVTTPAIYNPSTITAASGAKYNGAPPTFAAGVDRNTGWTYRDTRAVAAGGSNIQRFTHWATKIVKVEGIGGQGQNPDSAQLWQLLPDGTISNEGGVPPDEVYTEVRFHVMFEKVPYEVMFANGPSYRNSPAADPAFGGEFSRYCFYAEEPQSKYVQIRGGAIWDNDLTQYGQPGQAGASPLASAITAADQLPFANKEGIPKLVGENMVTWKWIDVPKRGFNWARIQSFFGSLNNEQFPPAGLAAATTSLSNPLTSYAPFRAYNKECLLLRTAALQPKNNIYGEPLNDITFFFHYSPAPDGYGYWNRLLNSNAGFQRYKARIGGGLFFTTNDFCDLFKP